MSCPLEFARARAHPLALVLLAGAVLAVARSSPTAVLMLSPALALLALLLAGRSPGEDFILRLRARRARRARNRRGGACALSVGRYAALFVHGSARISASPFAMRPPPAHAVPIA